MWLLYVINARSHGFLSRHLLVEGESPAEFSALLPPLSAHSPSPRAGEGLGRGGSASPPWGPGAGLPHPGGRVGEGEARPGAGGGGELTSLASGVTIGPVSLAVLSDANRQFRPMSYADGRWGCRLLFEFPMVKLLDYLEPARWAALAASDNVFALYEEQQRMPYVTTVEQAGIEKGVKQG